jgi:hypothetical protein
MAREQQSAKSRIAVISLGRRFVSIWIWLFYLLDIAALAALAPTLEGDRATSIRLTEGCIMHGFASRFNKWDDQRGEEKTKT